MPTFQWNNWTTKSQRDLETIAQHSPHEEDRITAVKYSTSDSFLEMIARTGHGRAAEEARRNLDESDDD